MARLVLVRHGQASLSGEDYDALSDLGRRQAACLGTSLARRGWQFEQVLVGPRQRHRQTADIAAEQWRQHREPLPDPRRQPALDEHHGPQVARWLQGKPIRLDGPLKLLDDDDAKVDQVLKAYIGFMRDWVAAVHPSGDFESWRAFRQRVGDGLRDHLADPRATLAFTSGGVLAAMVGEALGLDDAAVLDLSLQVANCAWSEWWIESGSARLVSFNVTPEFPEADWLTRV